MKREFITEHGPLLRRLAELKKLNGQNLNIHIYGESGVGKEVIARMIHEWGGDRERPFIPINSAGIPATLVESVLFGHEKGSFSGAIQNYKGKFEQANGGDLFLDEISELSPEIQAKLLRVLQDHEIDRIGSLKIIHSYFRLISASNKNLRVLVHEKQFREDLYYRINNYEIEIPALRERPKDIPLLVRHFMDLYSEEQIEIEPEGMEKLCTYEWPGNVRELESVMKLAITLARGGCIRKEDIRICRGRPVCLPSFGQIQEGQTHRSAPTEYDRLVQAYEKELIEKRLAQNNWHRIKTAKELGISRNRLYKKMQALGINS